MNPEEEVEALRNRQRKEEWMLRYLNTFDQGLKVYRATIPTWAAIPVPWEPSYCPTPSDKALLRSLGIEP